MHVVSIEHSAFRLCGPLESIEIPASVPNIGAEAFYWCESLELVILRNANTELGKNAFQEGCRVTKGSPAKEA